MTFDYLNATEFVTATDLKQFGNVHVNGVISGCAVTESAANMGVTVASGSALVDEVGTAVAGGTVTLASNPSNQRWSIVWIDDAGAVQVTNGDPAPNAQTEPSKPSITGTILKMYKVEAGQTIAANIAARIDKAVQTHLPINDSTLPAILDNIRDSTALIAFVDNCSAEGSAGATAPLPGSLGLRHNVDGSGDVSNVIATGDITLSTGTTANSQAVIRTGAKAIFGNRNPHGVFILTSAAAAAALKVQAWGFTEGSTANLWTGTTEDHAFFRSVTTGALFAVTGNATTEETTSLSGSHTPGTRGVFEVLTVDDGVSWQFKIGGTQVASHSTQVPDPTEDMYVATGIENNTTTNVEIVGLDLLYAYQDRS